MEKKSASILIAKIVVLLLSVLFVISSVKIMTNKIDINTIVGIIVICLTVYYMFIGYKVPHGNLLRYLFIIVNLASLIYFWHTFTNIEKKFDIYELLTLLEIMIPVYVSGRLNKFKENIILLSVVFAMRVFSCYHALALLNITSAPILVKVAFFNTAIIQLALIVSYIARYREHKEAGLEG